jgi:hypothetical protein
MLAPGVKAAKMLGMNPAPLPKSSSLATPPAPSAADMARARVEVVPLSQARSTQSKMDWDRFESGKHPPPLLQNYADRPVAVRREDGEYLIFDGHHRSAKAMHNGTPEMEMYVINAKDYAPEFAGRKPAKYDPAEIEALASALSPDAPLAAEAKKKSGLTQAPILGMDQPKGIRAYHGSPHDFDRFDLSKIGTGEGAQAYGHGLYFAENEGVARSYRDALSPTLVAKTAASPIEQRAAQMALNYGGDSAGAMKWLEANRGKAALSDDVVDSVLGRLRSGEFEKGGKMYEVAIHADPERFLDWDAPLSGPAYKDLLKADVPVQDWYSGRQAYKEAAFRAGKDTAAHPQATEFLREAGVPGIKYLDQGSRGKGDGSRNYVLFDDSIVEILKKYGVSSVAALPPAVQAAIALGEGHLPEE